MGEGQIFQMRNRYDRECPKCDRVTHHTIVIESEYVATGEDGSELGGHYQYILTQVCGNCGLIRHSEPIKWGPWLVRSDAVYKEWVKDDVVQHKD